MFKKVFAYLAVFFCLFGSAANAEHVTTKDFMTQLAKEGTRNSAIRYIGGVIEALNTMQTAYLPEQTKQFCIPHWATLSGQEVMRLLIYETTEPTNKSLTTEQILKQPISMTMYQALLHYLPCKLE